MASEMRIPITVIGEDGETVPVIAVIAGPGTKTRHEQLEGEDNE